MKDNNTTNAQLENGSPAFAKPVLPAVLPFVNEVACIDWEEGIKQVFDNSIDNIVTGKQIGRAHV